MQCLRGLVMVWVSVEEVQRDLYAYLQRVEANETAPNNTWERTGARLSFLKLTARFTPLPLGHVPGWFPPLTAGRRARISWKEE